MQKNFFILIGILAVLLVVTMVGVGLVYKRTQNQDEKIKEIWKNCNSLTDQIYRMQHLLSLPAPAPAPAPEKEKEEKKEEEPKIIESMYGQSTRTSRKKELVNTREVDEQYAFVQSSKDDSFLNRELQTRPKLGKLHRGQVFQMF